MKLSCMDSPSSLLLPLSLTITAAYLRSRHFHPHTSLASRDNAKVKNKKKKTVRRGESRNAMLKWFEEKIARRSQYLVAEWRWMWVSMSNATAGSALYAMRALESRKSKKEGKKRADPYAVRTLHEFSYIHFVISSCLLLSLFRTGGDRPITSAQEVH